MRVPVIRIRYGVEAEQVLKSRTSAALDGDSQKPSVVVFRQLH